MNANTPVINDAQRERFRIAQQLLAELLIERARGNLDPHASPQALRREAADLWMETSMAEDFRDGLFHTIGEKLGL